jgi:hypothetical protein
LAIPQPAPTDRSSKDAPASLRILLASLIDYAGLFPPAALSMKQAVESYDAYRRHAHSWMLGRLVVPVARLEEFEAALGELPAEDRPPNPSRLTAIAGRDLPADVAKIREFNRHHAPGDRKRTAVIESVEIMASSTEEIQRAARHLPRELEPYLEVPISRAQKDCLRAVASVPARLKVRTGGETPEMFPSSADLARFLSASAEAGLAFKATAGLHHPVRSAHRLTYELGSASGMMHGFLNLFLAAAFVRHGLGASEAQQLLAEETHESFAFDSQGVRWRDHRLANQELSSARRSFCISFGSCSFSEPIEDLGAIHLL